VVALSVCKCSASICISFTPSACASVRFVGQTVMFSVTLDITFTLSLQDTTEQQPRFKIKTVRFVLLTYKTDPWLYKHQKLSNAAKNILPIGVFVQVRFEYMPGRSTNHSFDGLSQPIFHNSKPQRKVRRADRLLC